MCMNQNYQRASAFVHRLLANPALKNHTSLQKEGQVSQFLSGNIHQLGPTLMSQAFFPGLSLDQIYELLQSTLRKLTDERLIPNLKSLVQRIDFSFVQFLQQQQIRPGNIQEQVLRVLNQALGKPEFRQQFSASYTSLHYNFTSKYLNEAYKMRRHVYFELTKVQRLKMSKDEVIALIEASILLKGLAHGLVSANAGEGRSGLISANSVQGIFDQLKIELTQLPPQVITSIINANISYLENPQVETTARLAAILSARGRLFVADIRVDRGADTPDKSWLGITRRNYKFYGFDIKMLDEMYMIAAENGW